MLNSDAMAYTSATQALNLVKSSDGILVFENEAHMYVVSDALWNDYDETLTTSLFNETGVETQRMLLEAIMQEEEKTEEKFFEPYSNFSEDEIEDLGLKSPRSSMYKAALSEGLLSVEVDNHDEHSYSLSVIDPTLSNVLNREGFVQVGDELRKYDYEHIRICNDCTTKDVSRV